MLKKYILDALCSWVFYNSTWKITISFEGDSMEMHSIVIFYGFNWILQEEEHEDADRPCSKYLSLLGTISDYTDSVCLMNFRFFKSIWKVLLIKNDLLSWKFHFKRLKGLLSLLEIILCYRVDIVWDDSLVPINFEVT